jgi:alkanesulfonate monooxygenase SsuD/methylene tetrahydromethanopterin reductase-like flavin-dependent oxidoreductase (luciferase family)
MKFSNFLFPQAESPQDDGRVIDETLHEARLSDALGVEVLWLAEHHFDGICAYVDPVCFAAAIAATTTRIKIGFAVAQMSLHHPIRMAEQMALIDNISHGRLIVGLGRGTAYNIYDYQGYGIDPDEAQARLLESEEIMIGAWSGENYVHEGRFWQLKLPMLRPRPFTKPHPPLIRACSGEASMVQMAREGRPFMMNVQTNAVTRQRMDLYRQTQRDCGHDEAAIARNVDESWVWRNVFVADTDAEAERIGIPALAAQVEMRGRMRRRIYAEQGVSMVDMESPTVAAREQPQHSLILGSPDTVAEAIAAIDDIGVGGLIMSFRMGPMPIEVAEHSLRLFMDKVAPRFR